MSFLHQLISRLRGYRNEAAMDQEFQDELEAHLAMAEEDFVRRGYDPAEARRLARVELGGVTQLRHAHREARGLPWIDAYWLDIKLGIRMLRKSWGLTLVGGFAMAVVIAIGGGVFNLFQGLLHATVPLDEGDRIVALKNFDGAAGRRVEPTRRDFERWREQLSSVTEMGAFREVERSLGIDGPVEGLPVTVAEMSPEGFKLARVAARLGRFLVEEDAAVDAPVVVLGHDVWTRRFGADNTIIGRSIRLGEASHTVVGVMPEGFAFPVNHNMWIPLRDAGDEVSASAPVFVFGRLAPGVELEQAQAELSAVGLLPEPLTGERRTGAPALEPKVLPYTLGFVHVDGGDEQALAALMLTLVVLLLVPPCANVAILIYARTVTRQEEIAARYVLGASRGRIVTQLFAEVLVLALLSAGAALVLVHFGGEYFQQTIALDGDAPFWIDFSRFSPGTVLFTAFLALIAALIAGAVPAIQATGRLMSLGLRALGSRTRLRLGFTWTALIVAQITLAVAVLPMAMSVSWSTLRPGILGPGFDAEGFLTVLPTQDSGDAASPEVLRELARRSAEESIFSSVALSAALPGREPWAHIEMGSRSSEPSGRPLISDFNRVDESFFETYDIRLLAGRLLQPADAEAEQGAVLINRTFAEQLAEREGDSEILGRRLRYIEPGSDGEEAGGPWFEIVGVIADVPENTHIRVIYHHLAENEPAAALSLELQGDAAAAAARLRDVAAAVESDLSLGDVLTLGEVYRRNQRDDVLPAYSLAAVTLCVLLLSAAGMYALMSFTVTRRRREIGIRAALGARPGRLLFDIFRRAFMQVGLGAALGVVMAGLLAYFLPLQEMGARELPGVVPAAALLMVLIGLGAAVVSSRRGLRIEPTEALRDG